MKVSELKRILKPLIKECVKEVIIEESGALSHIVTEVVSGLANSRELISENRIPTQQPRQQQPVQQQQPQRQVPNKNSFNKLREEMLTKIGQTAYKDSSLENIPQEQTALPELTQQPVQQLPPTRGQTKIEAFKEKTKTLNESFGGVDVFAGTKSLSEDENKADKGIDLDVFQNAANWKEIAYRKK